MGVTPLPLEATKSPESGNVGGETLGAAGGAAGGWSCRILRSLLDARTNAAHERESPTNGLDMSPGTAIGLATSVDAGL